MFGRLVRVGSLVVLSSAVAACAGAASTTVSAASLASGSRLVDLSHAYDEETIVWPTEEPFTLVKEFEGVTPGGFYYTANKFSAPEHGGTHIDAPIHFARGTATVDRIPIEHLMGPAVVVDVSMPCGQDPDHRVSVADFEEWERAHGQIPKKSIVLVSTGFGRYWSDRARYMGTVERGSEAVKKLHFPGLDAVAATWLAEARDVRAVGIDTPSIDYGPSTTFDAHRVLLAREVPVFENLANLDQLPARGATVIALPMKIKGGSGGPLRAIAIVSP